MKRSLYLLAILLMLILNSCDTLFGGDGDNANDGEFTTVTLTHGGFDFSENVSEPEWEVNDGEIIAWHAGTGNHPNYDRDENIWFRNDQIDQVNYKNQTMDMGIVDISKIKTIPSSWDDPVDPLMVGHVIIAKCHDGYVIFEVLEIDVENWEATVKYKFTDGSSF